MPDPGFGLYVHWPFCRAKCPYCDFNSHVRPSVDHAGWATALTTELSYWAERLEPRPLTSVFFGGGTPSLMEPSTVAAVLERAQATFGFADDIEITLEANPTSVEGGRFRGFREAGVNRVSLGVQALDDADLRMLGREHSVAEALAALDLATAAFPRVSFDLIYARPRQGEESWRRELERALGVAAGHLSLYQLTIEPGTRFHAMVRNGTLTPLPDEREAALFEVTQEVLEHAGLPAYEISNHARPGEECRHNLTYWRYGCFIGLGPGAHGRVALDGRLCATATERSPEGWRRRVLERGHGLIECTAIPEEERLDELLLMGLRLTEGVPVARLDRDHPHWRQRVDSAALERLRHSGLLVRDAATLRTTGPGRLLLNRIVADLLS